MMDESIRSWFSLWVQTSYRDIADRDYVSARLLYKYNLGQACLWSSLQAIEKYLKCILLYSYHSTKNFGHNLSKLWHAVEKLPRLNAKIPSDCLEFIHYLTIQGINRYLDYPQTFEGNELLKLDRSVWHIRCYCQDFYLLPGADELHSDDTKKMLAAIPQEATKQAIKSFHIPDGYLEKLLKDKDNPLRDILIWKNLYYGEYKKQKIYYRSFTRWERPIFMMRKEIFDYVVKVAYIPDSLLKELRHYWDEKSKEKKE